MKTIKLSTRRPKDHEAAVAVAAGAPAAAS